MPNALSSLNLAPKTEKLPKITPHTQLIKKVLPFAKRILCKPDDVIITYEKNSQSFYFVKEGAVEISYPGKKTKTTVAIIDKGEFFGEIGFFDQGPRIHDIKSLGRTELSIFNKESMDQMQQTDPSLYSSFVIYLTERICKKFRKILAEREPLVTYGASLTNRRRSYDKPKAIPESLLQSSSWRQNSKKIEELKSQFFDLTHELQAVIGDEIPDQYWQKGYAIADRMNKFLNEFDASMTEQEQKDHMWGFAFMEIFPYLMRSRLAERSYYKPKGYAGDFLMMEHIYQDVARGDGKIGKILDGWLMQRPGCAAIRGRRVLMRQQLETLSKKRLKEKKRFKIMNLACGPSRELFDFLKECDYTEKIDALCVDIDTEALHYSNQNVNNFPHSASVRYMTENLVKWGLGKVSHDIGNMDLIYSAGLFDYLEPRLFCKLVDKCHQHLEPGGSLLIGNFTPYDDMLLMDHLLHWKLIYRTREELTELFSKTKFGKEITILSEPAQVNLFVLADKD